MFVLYISIFHFVFFVLPITERLQGFVAHEHLGRNGTEEWRADDFLVDEFVAKVYGFRILLGVAEKYPLDACPIACTEAHGAWFAGGVDGATFQFEVFDFSACFADGTNLGMGRRVIVGSHSVYTCRQYLAIFYNDCSERTSAIGDALDG